MKQIRVALDLGGKTYTESPRSKQVFTFSFTGAREATGLELNIL